MKPLRFRAAAFHAAPPRSPVARAAGLVRLARARAKFKGGDLNLARRAASRALGRRVVGEGVLWLTIPRAGWRVVSREVHDLTGDHLAVLVTVRHRRSGTEVSFLVVNCMSVSTGARHAAAIMRKAIQVGADVILATECRDFTAADLRGAIAYEWWQPGAPGSSESGALVAVRRATADIVQRRLYEGSRATSEGGGIDTRSITVAQIKVPRRAKG